MLFLEGVYRCFIYNLGLRLFNVSEIRFNMIEGISKFRSSIYQYNKIPSFKCQNSRKLCTEGEARRAFFSPSVKTASRSDEDLSNPRNDGESSLSRIKEKVKVNMVGENKKDWTKNLEVLDG